MPTPSAILKAVQAAFEHEPRINLHQYPIHFALSNGDLIVDGEVANVAAKKLGLELAASVPGTTGIVDRLRVVPAQQMGDGAIRDHVRDAFLQEPVLQACTIQAWTKDQLETYREEFEEPAGVITIEVEDGVVTLNGRVPSLSHKRLAGVLVWWVPGSRDVINGLDVSPHQEDNDEEITEALSLVLEKDPFLHAGQIQISTQNAVVTLEGLVANEPAKDMAEFDAWYIFGVDKVVNNLRLHTSG